MSADRSWQISGPQKLDFDGPIEELHVRLVNGAVNVVGTEDPTARLEVSEVRGMPLSVTRTGGKLTVAYDDLPWKGFLKWLDRKGWRRDAVVSVCVPAGARLSVGVVGANAVVSGIRGRTEVRGISGGTTLVGLSGETRAETVSGGIETQDLSGPFTFNSISGDLTMMAGSGPAVRGDSVSGDIILDLDSWAEGTDIGLNTVSGEVALRLPPETGARVDATTTSGALSSAFDELRVDGGPGLRRVSGILGGGGGTLRAGTVSGAVALLRRPLPQFTGESGESGEPGEPGRGPARPPGAARPHGGPTLGKDV